MLSKDELLMNYSNSVKQLLRESEINEDQFERIYLETLAELDRTEITNRQHKLRRWKGLFLCLFLTIIVIYNVKPVYRFAVCALQEYIYPGLRLLRTISIPFIAAFPGLTELYDETCLLQNPLFRVVDMECWPCSGIDEVVRTARPDHSMTQHHKPPFVYKTNQRAVSLTDLQQLYEGNAAVFDRDALKIYSNGKRSTTPKDMFDAISHRETLLTQNYYVWRINRIAPAQVLRVVIPRPKIVPRLGQSTERFVLIDFSSASFRLPDPECNFAFLLQVKGDRMLELQPAKECAGHCKAMTVLLKESYLLWYNWWYWRPITQVSSKNETSIAHMGSYC